MSAYWSMGPLKPDASLSPKAANREMITRVFLIDGLFMLPPPW